MSLAALILLVTTSTWHPAQGSDRIRKYSRRYEFDYVRWELSAIWNKLLNSSSGFVFYLNDYQQRKIIDDYFYSLNTFNQLQQKLNNAYSEPQKTADKNRLLRLEVNVDRASKIMQYHRKIAESVIQYQISQVLRELNLANLGTPFPPVLFQATKLPKQLIISPRDKIFQEKSISLSTDITLVEIIDLENKIEDSLEYSALVVPIGGVGTYPSMVINSTSLRQIIETVAHEWTHNYLTLRPLGISYSASPQLRTMNETTANIAGDEISQAVIEAYYPDLQKKHLISPAYVYASTSGLSSLKSPDFIFSKEIYQTRVEVDRLLAEGKIDDAEAFMEARRQIFWENGYQIRKLNQAYFAFYGAYADEPFSAAGRDPVGDNVRILRARQPTLAAFINKISWMSSYSELKIAARAF